MLRWAIGAIGLLCASLSLTAPASASIAPVMRGRANPAAIVRAGNARFTVLTPRLIRMEWSPRGDFVDAPSQVFIDREQPVPEYTSKRVRDTFFIETAALRLTYRPDAGRFDAGNLEIRSRKGMPRFDWHPGDLETGNLGGTARTLDRYDGDTHLGDGAKLTLEAGLLSRDGWHVVDDSTSFVFDASPHPWIHARRCDDCQDLYFMGYGHAYTQALADFARVAGPEPMPPRFAFGYWWSRYWNYSDSETRALVADFARFAIPLDVLVIDMDWHRTDGLSWDKQYAQTDSAGESKGWTGYTWNTSLFPDPRKFLAWLHQQPLKTTLNLHPASGIQPHEERYPAFARAMGIAAGTPVPFEAADPRFVDTLFDLVLDPLQRDGVDFWWLDWQQWPTSRLLPGLSNTWWLNHSFYTHMQAQDAARALIYHRWGGLGNHRYQIGFSGDSVVSWASLAYQPFFTATASNVLYGYWSHDIGGHMFPEGTPASQRQVDPELYVRWMQFGVFSPILRTHSSKEAALRKEPWRFPPDAFAAIRQAIELRYRLAPYIYTAAREAYDSGVSLLRPLYYAWPEEPQAYRNHAEYLFGDDILVAPVARSMQDGFARVSIWLPPGRWYDTQRGALFDGNRIVARDYTLDETPVFIRAGAIIPLGAPSLRNLQSADDGRRVLSLTPGGSAHTRLYDDAGDSEAYRRGEYAFTTIDSERDEHAVTLTIHPPQGSYAEQPASRRFTVELPDVPPLASVAVDGSEYARTSDGHDGGWSYDGDRLTARVMLPPMPRDRLIRVSIRFADDVALATDLRYRMKRVSSAVEWLKDRWNSPAPLPDDLSLLAQLGRLIDDEPDRFRALVRAFQARLATAVDTLDATHVDQETKVRFAQRLQQLNTP